MSAPHRLGRQGKSAASPAVRASPAATLRVMSMRILAVAALGLALLSPALLRADVKTQERTQVRFEGAIGRDGQHVRRAGRPRGRDQHRVAQGPPHALDHRRHRARSSTWPRRRSTTLDLKGKSYIVVTFAEMRQADGRGDGQGREGRRGGQARAREKPRRATSRRRNTTSTSRSRAAPARSRSPGSTRRNRSPRSPCARRARRSRRPAASCSRRTCG